MTLDAEIARAASAMMRREDALREMRISAKGGCCPSCVHGRAYSDLAGKQSRTGAWLRVLLAKRASPGDTERAESIRVGAWP